MMLEVGGRLFPRLYKRHGDLRDYQEARKWAESLDWRNNPYDRYLLRRELLHYIEAQRGDTPGFNIGLFMTREQILKEIDRLLNDYPKELKRMGIFLYVLGMMPFRVGKDPAMLKRKEWMQSVAEEIKVRNI